MRQITFTIFALVAALLASAQTSFAQEYTLTGRVVDSSKSPVSYATVVLLDDGKQVSGEVTNDTGEFTIKAATNTYTMLVSFVGYAELQQQVELNKNVNLGDITLQESSVEIDAVMVKANLIRREADRYIVDVANSPLAVGRDVADVLKIAPGVWVNDDNISINGAPGTKIFINGRESKMSGTELINFLRSMSSDEVQRIDVIPQSGADYDASASGGIIKIVTKRKVDTGLMGNAGLRLMGRKNLYTVRPSVSLDYNQGKLNLYARVNGSISESDTQTSENTSYREGTTINSLSEVVDKIGDFSANGGIMYDFTERHSVGAEFSHYQIMSKSTTLTDTKYTANNLDYYSQGDYFAHHKVKRSTATVNYIYKMDEIGSEMKILADYTNSKTPGDNDYHDALNLGGSNAFPSDSIYRSASRSNYHLATVTASIDKFLSEKVQIRAGAKYTFNKNTSITDHEWKNALDQWQHNDEISYNIGYTENIGAAYVAATANVGRWSLVGGLRGEYTDFVSADKSIKQSYFDLFPNANVSYALSEDGSNSLIAQYSRTIHRPSFWDLSPYENKVSEFSVMRGNPNLKATYKNSVSLTAVMGYKYSITVGMNVTKNTVEVITARDERNPNMIVIMPTNLDAVTDYFANINAPIDITKWWSANLSFAGQYLRQRFNDHDPVRGYLMGMGSLMMSYILPKEFYIDVDGYYLSSSVMGNVKTRPMGDINVSFKKRMFDNKLTLTLGMNNLVAAKTRSSIDEKDFTSTSVRHGSMLRRYVSFAASYRFNSGKRFNAKSVESGSLEDLMRLGGN